MDIKRLLNIVLYILNKVGETSKTKLMKLIFFADFEHTKRYNKPMIWSNYCRLEKGPALSYLLYIINTAIGTSNYATERDVKRFKEVIQIELRKIFNSKAAFLIPLKEPELEDISQSEQKVLDLIVKKYGWMNAKQLSEETHKHPAWKQRTDEKRIKFSDVIEDERKKEYFKLWEEDFEALNNIY